jgi:DNA mismatch endonuclease (patch repair protein)
MARVRGKNTAPELAVRRTLHAMGLRFRLHRKDLPGKPDIVLTRHRLVIFVHGCFWHRHSECRRASVPQTRRNFWSTKFKATMNRDKVQSDLLNAAGWKVLTIWECEVKDPQQIRTAVQTALASRSKAAS